MFSRTTIASSTTNPTDKTNPKSISRFIENPKNFIKIKTPTSDTGIAQNGIKAELIVPKNKYVTPVTRITASTTAQTTSFIDSRTNSVSSC